MIRWPEINREPVQLPMIAGYGLELWETLIELADLRPGEWTLIGGQMVFVHAIEQGVEPLRMSSDLDVLVNARILTGGVREFVRAIERQGFELAGWSPTGLAHRYYRGPVNIDVLAPEGLGPRTDITTTPPGRTLQVPGGTQALARTELVPIAAGYSTGLVPRPSLLGAIIIKAVAIYTDDLPRVQQSDLALLLSLLEQPTAIHGQLTAKDWKRLRRCSEMLDREHWAWSALPHHLSDRGHSALRLLID